MKHVETGTSEPVTILVTGFGAFPGARSNPTTALIAALGRQCARFGRLGVCLEMVALPVVYDHVGPALRAAATGARPDAILHLGLAGRRRAMSVEARAVNRANPLHPDAARRRTAQTLLRHGPAWLAASYPTARITVAARRARVRTEPSIDAGDYVCNATLYLTLAEQLAPQAGFLHVPRPRNATQPCRRTRMRRPDLHDLTRAICAALLVMAREERRGRVRAR